MFCEGVFRNLAVCLRWLRKSAGNGLLESTASSKTRFRKRVPIHSTCRRRSPQKLKNGYRNHTNSLLCVFFTQSQKQMKTTFSSQAFFLTLPPFLRGPDLENSSKTLQGVPMSRCTPFQQTKKTKTLHEKTSTMTSSWTAKTKHKMAPQKQSKHHIENTIEKLLKINLQTQSCLSI